MRTEPKLKLCANKINGCKVEFVRWNSLTQKCCSTECSIQYATTTNAEKRRKAFDRETRHRKEALKTVTQLIQECQRTCFNPWIRFRDRNEPCISCGDLYPTLRDKFGGVWDAGHFLSTGSTPELRFHEDNCHRQCKSCNSPGPNKSRWVAAEYRVNLIKKIGIQRVEWLEGPHDAAKYTREDVKDLKALFRRKLKDAKQQDVLV